jgi:hypothetical protein
VDPKAVPIEGSPFGVGWPHESKEVGDWVGMPNPCLPPGSPLPPLIYCHPLSHWGELWPCSQLANANNCKQSYLNQDKQNQ